MTKGNWFKVGILGVMILVGSSIAYYYFWSLPQRDKEELIIKKAEEQNILNEENRKSQEECSTEAGEYLKKYYPNFGNRLGEQFRFHFNQRVNKCFIFVQDFNMHDDGDADFSKFLGDVLELKQYGYLQKMIPKNRAEYAVKPFVCEMLDKYCKTDEEFDAFVKKYMED